MAKKKAKKKKETPAISLGMCPKETLDPALKAIMTILESANKDERTSDVLAEALECLKHFGKVSNIMIRDCHFEGFDTGLSARQE